jgi:hypothetical protein
MSTLSEMTTERWESLTPAERDELRDNSALHPKLAPYVGWRVRVEPKPEFRPATFIVGRTTGWRPSLLALRAYTQHGSSDLIRADERIDRVTLIEKVR